MGCTLAGEVTGGVGGSWTLVLAKMSRKTLLSEIAAADVPSKSLISG